MHNKDMNKVKLSCLVLSIILPAILWANIGGRDSGIFSGRISKLNTEAGLVRVKINFPNIRYLNKKDQVQFWNDNYPKITCVGYVIGKTNEYFLIRVPDYNTCERSVHLRTGNYLKFFSQDLVNNLKMGRELMKIMQKKRQALGGKLQRTQKELDSYIEMVNALNDRYEVLREKLEGEWRLELANLEEDRSVSLRNFKNIEMRIEEIDLKLQKYKVEDENLSLDRWALDPRLFFKK